MSPWVPKRHRKWSSRVPQKEPEWCLRGAQFSSPNGASEAPNFQKKRCFSCPISAFFEYAILAVITAPLFACTCHGFWVGSGAQNGVAQFMFQGGIFWAFQKLTIWGPNGCIFLSKMDLCGVPKHAIWESKWVHFSIKTCASGVPRKMRIPVPIWDSSHPKIGLLGDQNRICVAQKLHLSGAKCGPPLKDLASAISELLNSGTYHEPRSFGLRTNISAGRGRLSPLPPEVHNMAFRSAGKVRYGAFKFLYWVGEILTLSHPPSISPTLFFCDADLSAKV